jgi:iron complex outermembrane receptor protein
MKLRISGGLVLIASPTILGLAFASDVRAQQQSAPADTLQEVVITAEKRTSTVQETPISISAITGKELADRGITDIAGIVDSVPGVSMRQSGPGQTEIEMRGMTSSGGNSSTVGFYLDDTPLTAPASAQNGKVVIDPNLYDLNRIEVLRGPQGTLYGSGSMGGTIKLVPNAPDTHAFDASGQLILGDTGDGGGFNHGENAMVNLPLANDVAALRLVGSQEHVSGWIDRIVIAQPDFPSPTGTVRGNVAAAPIAAQYNGVNDEDLTSFRASLLLKPTEKLSITPSFLYQKITMNGLSLIDSNPGTYTQYQPFDNPEPFTDRIDIGSLNIQYHFDFADLSSTTSYWTRDEQLRQDGSEEIAEVLGLPYYTSQGGAGQNSPTSLEDDRSWQTSEEIRLTSAGDTQLKWLVGYFYQDFESDWNLFVDTPFTVVPGTVPNAFTQYQPTKIIQTAFFGEVSYKFLPELTGTAGLRHYEYSGSVNTAVSGWLSSSGGNLIDNFSTGERNQGFLPKFNLSYEPDKNLLLYGTIAEGFRPGGGNQPIPTTGALGSQCLTDLQQQGLNAAPLGFNPDSVWSYELGEKFRSSDAHVTLNSAVYFENWEHIQQNIPLACGFPYTGNAGDAHIYGGEVELDALLAPGLLLALNGGYSHGRYVANAVPATTIDERVQDVPDWTSAVSLSYRHMIAEKLNFVARVDNSYVGTRIDTTAQANLLPSYDLTNIRAGVEGDRWTANVFVNNLADKVALFSNSPAINVNVPSFNRTSVAQPRTFGIDLSYRFGP